jgi:hypothetical protein
VRESADFLVLGSGVAGLRAAAALAPHGRVLVLTKADDATESNTGYAQGGIAAAVGDDDSPALHASDTFAAGDGLCDAAAVQALVTDGPAYVRELADWGAQFAREADGRFALGREGAHSVRRVLHAHDATGREIARVLWTRVSALPTVRILNDARAVSLLVERGVCVGARVIHAGRRLEARDIERVGGGKPIPVDVRILAATNKDLQRAVRDGSFREDLFFRLNVIPVALAPLRERPDDIPLLVQHFTTLTRLRTGHRLPEWHDNALQLFSRYRWPGNVRELGNIVERLIILHAGQPIRVDDVRRVIAVDDAPLAAPERTPLPDPSGLETSLSDQLDDYERLLITRALAASNGNISEAARRLQTDRPNLYRRMNRLEIGPVGVDLTHPT